MITGRKAYKIRAPLSAFACRGGGKAPQAGRAIYWQPYSDNYQFTKAGCNQKRILFVMLQFWARLSGTRASSRTECGQGWPRSQGYAPETEVLLLFLTERCRNVIENKGSLWKTRERCRNVHENTGT